MAETQRPQRRQRRNLIAIIGQERQFFDKHRFVVEIPGFDYAGFAKCSELKATATLRKHWEGGSTLPHKGIGRHDYENVTLERGATRDLDLYLCWQRRFFKQNISIVQLDTTGAPLMRHDLYGAFPVEFVAGEWDAASDDVVISKITFAYDRFLIRPESASGAQTSTMA